MKIRARHTVLFFFTHFPTLFILTAIDLSFATHFFHLQLVDTKVSWDIVVVSLGYVGRHSRIANITSSLFPGGETSLIHATKVSFLLARFPDTRSPSRHWTVERQNPSIKHSLFFLPSNTTMVNRITLF